MEFRLPVESIQENLRTPFFKCKVLGLSLTRFYPKIKLSTEKEMLFTISSSDGMMNSFNEVLGEAVPSGGSVKETAFCITESMVFC